MSAASFQSLPIFSHTTRYLPVTSCGVGPLVLRLKVPISRAADGPNGLTVVRGVSDPILTFVRSFRSDTADFGAANWNYRCGGSRIDPQPLIYDYCATSLQAVHDYVTPVSGRSSGLFPRLRYVRIGSAPRMRACRNSFRLPPGWRLNESGIAMPSTTTSSTRCSSLWPATTSLRVVRF
jgi:hypothetical protein